MKKVILWVIIICVAVVGGYYYGTSNQDKDEIKGIEIDMIEEEVANEIKRDKELEVLNSLIIKLNELKNFEIEEEFKGKIITTVPIKKIDEAYKFSTLITETEEILAAVFVVQGTYNLNDDTNCRISIIRNNTDVNSGLIFGTVYEGTPSISNTYLYENYYINFSFYSDKHFEENYILAEERNFLDAFMIELQELISM